MLPTHGRYDYSNITPRPDYTWPGGRRLAVYLALNIEAFGFGVGKGAAIAPPDQAQSHSIYSWRDYGNRVGIWRMLRTARRARPARRGADEHRRLRALHPTSRSGSARAATRSWATASPIPTSRGISARATSATLIAARHRHHRAPRGRAARGLDEPVALQQRASRMDLLQEAGLPLRDGLDDGRPADLAAHPRGPHPLDALSHRGERYARDHLVPLHRRTSSPT